ncbi:DUF4913 domain-containing protein [Streptomyces sp. NPDC058307]|uniref:DUF4913 domain-containing protein n=1 Tax=Streptomyces sp. NPDC058307 TaxID=3346439 RepID=UPI0036ED8310
MTADTTSTGQATGASPQPSATASQPRPGVPAFILYLQGEEYGRALRSLTLWVHHVLLPVYGREVTSTAPWCSSWWEHPEAVAQMHGLWLAWTNLTDTSASSGVNGPATWHRDFLSPVMNTLRDQSGPFAGCKAGTHRPKEAPTVDLPDPFAPPPARRPARA